MESAEEIAERAEYLPSEMLYDPDYFSNVEGAQIQGLIMIILLAYVIIFKVLRKFKAPTEKPIKRDETVGRAAFRITSEIGSRVKLSFMIRLAFIIHFFMSLIKKKSPIKPEFIEKVCSKCKNKFSTFKGDEREICENCRFPIS